MIWWMGAIAAGAAAWRFLQADQGGWAATALVIALVAVWTAAISMNLRRGAEQQVPELLALANVASVVAGIAVFVASLIVVS